MRIAWFHDVPMPSHYAAPIQILNTARALCDLGASVTVFCGAVAGEEAALFRFYGVAPHDNLRVVPCFTRGRRIAERLGRRGPLLPAGEAAPDVILARGAAAEQVYARHVEDRIDHPLFVCDMHRLAPLAAAAPEARAVRGADGVVVVSQGLLEDMRSRYAPDAPVLLLPGGTAPPEGDIPRDEIRDIDIAYAGKFEDRKGLPLFLRALAALPGRRAVAAGGTDAERRRIRALARREGVLDRLDLPGYVEPARIRALLARARVGVCPPPVGSDITAERHGSPLKLPEMMAAGTPIVAGDLPAVREIVTDGRTALLVPPGDPAALAEAIGRLLEDRDLAGRLAAAAREDVAGRTWPGRGRRLMGFLGKIPARGR